MVAQLEFSHPLTIYEEIGNIFSDISSREAECYKDVANHSQRIFTLIQNNKLVISIRRSPSSNFPIFLALSFVRKMK